MNYSKIFFTLILMVFSLSIFSAPALTDLQGNPVKPSDLKGSWVFINYWASWCHPCLEEIPELNKFYNQYKNDQVRVFGVNYDGVSVSKQKQLMKDLGIKYPGLSSDPARALSLGAVRGVPVTFILNPHGKLVKTLYGPQTAVNLRRVVN